jgi:hypothetical protein
VREEESSGWLLQYRYWLKDCERETRKRGNMLIKRERETASSKLQTERRTKIRNVTFKVLFYRCVEFCLFCTVATNVAVRMQRAVGMENDKILQSG